MLRRLSGISLGLIGGLHLVRVFSGWELVLGQWGVPVWFSVTIGMFLLLLAWANLCPS